MLDRAPHVPGPVMAVLASDVSGQAVGDKADVQIDTAGCVILRNALSMVRPPCGRPRRREPQSRAGPRRTTDRRVKRVTASRHAPAGGAISTRTPLASKAWICATGADASVTRVHSVLSLAHAWNGARPNLAPWAST